MLMPRLWAQLTLAEVSGSLGDLGTLIPLMVPLAQQGSIHFVPALFFAGVANVATGLVWDVPMCVQPMKTIAAVALTEGLSAVQVTAAGMQVSALVLVLGITRGIVLVNNVIPTAVVCGIQIGLGLSLMRKGATLVLSTGSWASSVDGYLLGACCFGLVLLLSRSPRVPIALLLFVLGLLLAALELARGAVAEEPSASSSASIVVWALEGITSADATHALVAAALPQLPLTTLNSIVSTCKLSADLFPERPRLSHAAVACSVGLVNLASCALGGMPVCHGAGGLAAQHRFGARHGASMVLLGSAKACLALIIGGALMGLLRAFPAAILGVLLTFSGLELASAGGRPLASQSEVGLTVAFLTAAGTLVFKTGGGCLVGLAAALLCGGYKDVIMLLRSRRLGEHLLRGVSCCGQPPLLQPQTTAADEERATSAPPPAGLAPGHVELPGGGAGGGGGGSRACPD